MSLAYANSSRALAYLTERGEDALVAVKSLIGTGSGRYLDTDDDNVSTIRPQLESSSDTERLEGLRRVVALISKGRDASPFFASVTKLASTSSIEIRKLVYIIVLRYAPSHPDIALLSINSFQRDLTDPNPLIRGMSLRTLSSVRLKILSPIVLLAAGKAARDSHPYVRKIGVLALPKCFRMEPSQHDSLVDLLGTYLRDRSPLVLGPTAAVFTELCPDNWALLHRHFRQMCNALIHMDAWSIPPAVDLLVRYARQNIPRPDAGMDEDLQLLITSVEPLLESADDLVAMAAIRALYFLTPNWPSNMIRTLVRLVQRSPPESAYISSLVAHSIALEKPATLAPFILAFFVRHNDPEYLGLVKIRVLVRIVQHSMVHKLVDELFVYTHKLGQVAVDSVTAIGQLTTYHPTVADHALRRLLDVAQNSTQDAVTARTVQVAKTIIQLRMASGNAEYSKSTAVIVARFAMHLFTPLARKGEELPRVIRDATSRSDVLWLLGQYASLRLPVQLGSIAEAPLAAAVAPDVLRCLVAHWSMEEAPVKTQALTLSSKVLLVLQDVPCSINRIVLMLHYELLSLSARDSEADVRDRARFYSGLTRRLDYNMPGNVPDDVEAYLAAHEALDKYRLAGVRLRREQVWHVLFEQGESRPVPMELSIDASVVSSAPDHIPSAKGTHLTQWGTLQVPEWNDPSNLPSPLVRVPDAQSLKADNVRSISSSSPWFESDRSLGSGASASEIPTMDHTPSNVTNEEKIVLVPTQAENVRNARYQDLDSFLDASSEEDEGSLDDSAPEDSEYSS